MAILNDLLTDALSRVRDKVRATVTDLSADELAFRPEGRGNSIAWLVWHLARVEDAQISAAAGAEPLWDSAGWRQRFDLPFDASATGYGQSSDEVAQVRPGSPALLVEYYDAVNERTQAYVAGLTDDDLQRVVDESWDPPVTLAVRLVSVINDVTQHAGQAAYARGLVRTGS